MSKLLEPVACPFCGVKPIVMPENSSVEGDGWGRVECHHRTCPVDLSISVYSDTYSKTKAIKKWNTTMKKLEKKRA